MKELIIFLLGLFILLVLLALCGCFACLVLMIIGTILELYKEVRKKWKKLCKNLLKN